MLKLNCALERVEPSKSVELLAKTRKLQETDPSVINLTAGEPDFATPEVICAEVYRCLKEGYTHYGDSNGDLDLRKALSRKLTTENNAPYGPDNILITPGGKYAIYLAVQALVNPGDEVLWLTPGWVSYPAIITLCGGTPIAVNLEYDKDYALSCEQLEAKTTEKTKLLIINYPNNPTGKILHDEELIELKKYMLLHPDVYLLSDEIYEKLIYDGRNYVSPASDPDLFNRVLVVNGFSKSSAMTGWRVGYLACSGRIISGVRKIFSHSISSVSSFIQKGAIKALEHPEETERMRQAYEKRRNLLFDGFYDIPNAEFKLPEGSFYAWVKFDTEMTSEQLCEKLLVESKIAAIPGEAYGEENGCLVRFCYAAEESVLREMLLRLRSLCENL